MASLASKALPSHLKDSMSNGEGNGAFERKHHGKTQSHVVSPFLYTLGSLFLRLRHLAAVVSLGLSACLLSLTASPWNLLPALH